MTIDEWLQRATSLLHQASVPSAHLDSEILLSDKLKKDRSWLQAHSDEDLSSELISLLDPQIEARTKHVPIAYIREKQEFYGREFSVSPDTLTPRPETETLVELALKLVREESIPFVADIGTGSGCIIITLALEQPELKNCAGYELSTAAIEIAQKNVKKYSADVTIVEDDLTQKKIHGWQQSKMIVANLPYVPADFHINLAATHEPPFAIFGGEDGLDLYRELFAQLSDKNRYVLTESLPFQHEQLAGIAKNAGYELIEQQDFIQVFKSA